MSRLRTTAALALALALAAPTARANYYDIYGFNARAIGMAGAMTAAADDYTTTYYNPGAMTAGKQARLGFGVNLSLPSLYVERAQGDSAHETADTERALGFSLGWLYSFGGIFEDRLALGVSLFLPTSTLARAQGVDRQAPQFYMYQNLHDKMLFHAAVAYELFEGVSLGVGVQILANLTGAANLQLDIVDGTFERREFSVELGPTMSPVIGLHVRPLEGLSFGATFRGRNDVRFSLPIRVAEGDAFDLDLQVSQTVLFSPDQLALGMSYRMPEVALRMAFDAVVAFWAGAPDPSPRIRGDIGGRLLEGLGLGDALDLSVRSPGVDLGFANTVSPRFGFEWETLDWLLLRTGYAFRPTPAPRATGTTAYLDNDAHVVSLGAGFVFDDPLRVHIHPVSLDLGFQAVLLPRRTVPRRAPGDPVGSLSHGGTVWTVSASVNHAF